LTLSPNDEQMDNYQLLGFAEQVYNVMFEFVAHRIPEPLVKYTTL